MNDPLRLPPYARRPGFLARAVATVAAVLIAAVAFFLGLFFIAIIAGLVVIAAGAIWARLWWLTRGLRKQMKNAERRDEPGGDSKVIEGEYSVRDERRDES